MEYLAGRRSASPRCPGAAPTLAGARDDPVLQTSSPDCSATCGMSGTGTPTSSPRPPSATRGGSCDRTARRHLPGRGLRELVAHGGGTADRRGRRPGSIDALLARYFLGSAPVPGLNRDGSRLSAAWLEENQDRLWQTPVVAAIGYGLAARFPASGPGPPHAGPRLRRLMSRNPFADRLTFVYDLPQLVGIGLAASGGGRRPSRVRRVARGRPARDRLQPSDRFQALLRAHVRALLTGQRQPCMRSRVTTYPSSPCATGWRPGTAHAARPR